MRALQWLRNPYVEAVLLLLVWALCVVYGTPDPASLYGDF
jgi:hypothetical protein